MLHCLPPVSFLYKLHCEVYSSSSLITKACILICFAIIVILASTSQMPGKTVSLANLHWRVGQISSSGPISCDQKVEPCELCLQDSGQVRFPKEVM